MMRTNLMGLRIVALRAMTTEELEAEGWGPRNSVAMLILEDGSKIYASSDDEGNGPGALFGLDLEGAFRVQAPPARVFMPPPPAAPKKRGKKTLTAT